MTEFLSIISYLTIGALLGWVAVSLSRLVAAVRASNAEAITAATADLQHQLDEQAAEAVRRAEGARIEQERLSSRIHQLEGYFQALGLEVSVLDDGFWATKAAQRLRISIESGAKDGEPDRENEIIVMVARKLAPSATIH